VGGLTMLHKTLNHLSVGLGMLQGGKGIDIEIVLQISLLLPSV